jgi:glucose/arabinose dehydrogenase
MRKVSVLALLVVCAGVFAAPVAARQAPLPSQATQPQPQGTPPPGRPVAAASPSTRRTAAVPAGRAVRGRWEPPSQNVRLDVTIIDTGDQTARKIVSMLVADGDNGRIRSGNNQGVLNVDGRPQVALDGRVYVSITIEYSPDRSTNTTTLNESISLMLAAGKPTLVSQSADPGSDRRVSVEVTATIVK